MRVQLVTLPYTSLPSSLECPSNTYPSATENKPYTLQLRPPTRTSYGEQGNGRGVVRSTSPSHGSIMQHNLCPARNGSVLGYAHLEVRFGWFGHWGREWSKRKRDEIKVMVRMLLLLLLVQVRENIHHPVLIISLEL
ncbi:hypothetical protein BDR03DRAFT_957883 [Suillus americanus]|nr:hypothetical protein BDR03DRAFT_957883 [Suillus americanus]